MNASDQVRQFVRDRYILPARKKGVATVTVRAGDVHKALKWDSKRVPQVCSALSTRKFMQAANVDLVSRKGPPSGQSTTVEFTYRLREPDEDARRSAASNVAGPERVADGWGLQELRGLLQEEFRSVGGGEAFLKAERESWGPDVWERYEAEEAERSKKRT